MNRYDENPSHRLSSSATSATSANTAAPNANAPPANPPEPHFQDDPGEKRRRGDGPPPKPLAKICAQFRETTNMTYELDCEGQSLIVKIFPLTDDSWRIDAQMSRAEGAIIATGTAGTRALALEAVAQWWRDHTNEHMLASYDWKAIAVSLSAVRAI